MAGILMGLNVKNGSSWEDSIPYVKVGSTWKRANAYVKDGAKWARVYISYEGLIIDDWDDNNTNHRDSFIERAFSGTEPDDADGAFVTTRPTWVVTNGATATDGVLKLYNPGGATPRAYVDLTTAFSIGNYQTWEWKVKLSSGMNKPQTFTLQMNNSTSWPPTSSYEVQVKNNGQLRLHRRGPSNAYLATVSSVFSLDTWYTVTYCIRSGPGLSDQQHRVYVDGTQKIDVADNNHSVVYTTWLNSYGAISSGKYAYIDWFKHWNGSGYPY
jgi:hypothetical protein